MLSRSKQTQSGNASLGTCVVVGAALISIPAVNSLGSGMRDSVLSRQTSHAAAQPDRLGSQPGDIRAQPGSDWQPGFGHSPQASEPPSLGSSSQASIDAFARAAIAGSRALERAELAQSNRYFRSIPDRIYPNTPRAPKPFDHPYMSNDEYAMAAIAQHLREHPNGPQTFNPEAKVYNDAFGPSWWETLRGRGEAGRNRRDYFVGLIHDLKREIGEEEWNRLLQLRGDQFYQYNRAASMPGVIGLRAILRAQSDYYVPKTGKQTLSDWDLNHYKALLGKGGFVGRDGNPSLFGQRVIATTEMLSEKGLSSETRSRLFSDVEVGGLPEGISLETFRHLHPQSQESRRRKIEARANANDTVVFEEPQIPAQLFELARRMGYGTVEITITPEFHTALRVSDHGESGRKTLKFRSLDEADVEESNILDGLPDDVRIVHVNPWPHRR